MCEEVYVLLNIDEDKKRIYLKKDSIGLSAIDEAKRQLGKLYEKAINENYDIYDENNELETLYMYKRLKKCERALKSGVSSESDYEKILLLINSISESQLNCELRGLLALSRAYNIRIKDGKINYMVDKDHFDTSFTKEYTKIVEQMDQEQR